MFGIIVTGKEARSGNPERSIVAQAGEKFWVCTERDGWVDATSLRCTDPKAVPGDIKIFKTTECAEKFAKKWKGHPWWCQPDTYEVVELHAKTKVVVTGYEVA
jgi:hypothetical protein